MAELNLFNEFFLEFVRAKFVNQPNKYFTAKEIYNESPHFYQDHHMISAAMNIMHLDEQIEVYPDDPNRFKVTETYLKQLADERENESLNKSMDMAVKRLSEKTLRKQLWHYNNMWWVEFLKILAPLVIGFIFGKLTQ